MASLKLKVKQRETLYYNKYKYKVSVHGLYLYLINTEKPTLSIYRERVKNIRSNHWVRKEQREPTNKEYRKVYKIIKFFNNFRKHDDVTTRIEGNTLSMFSNDITLFEDIETFSPNSIITEVELLPAGVKYFRNEPKHQYRLYFKGKRIDYSIKEELIEYVNRTPNLMPSPSCSEWLERSYLRRYSYTYMQSNFFIDYDDPSVLTMMHILFPGNIGKSYKLEKQPLN